MKGIVFLLLVFKSVFIFAGNGARSQGIGGYSQTTQDVWSAENNIAALAFYNKLAFGLYLENKYLIKETSRRAFVLSLPIFKGVIGVSANRYGYRLFNESQYGISYSKLLGENISMGIQLKFYQTKISESYGIKNGLSGNIGIMAKITEKLHMGTSIINPTKLKLSHFQDERYPTILITGMSYHFSKKVFLGVEIDKTMGGTASLNTGLEYHPMDMLYLRAGISTNPAVSHFGFGLKFNHFQLDLATSFHSDLGTSPHISLCFFPSSKEAEK